MIQQLKLYCQPLRSKSTKEATTLHEVLQGTYLWVSEKHSEIIQAHCIILNKTTGIDYNVDLKLFLLCCHLNEKYKNLLSIVIHYIALKFQYATCPQIFSLLHTLY